MATNAEVPPEGPGDRPLELDVRRMLSASVGQVRPSLRTRLAVAAALGLAGAAVFLVRVWLQGGDPMGDLGVILPGVERLLEGENVFRTRPTIPGPTRTIGSYPLPAFMVAAPFALLPPVLAGPTFVFLTTFVAAFLLSRTGLMRLWLFASFGSVKAWMWAQWSPLLLCVAVSAWAAPLAMCKPNIGLPLLAGYLRWRGVGMIVLTVLLAQLILPTWIVDWLKNLPAVVGAWEGADDVHSSFPYYVPAVLPLGLPLLLAGLRWRDPLGRLVFVQACLPQQIHYYDQLALGLVPQTPRRMLLWVGLGWMGAAALGVGVWIFGMDSLQDVLRWTSVPFLWYPVIYFLLVRPEEPPPATGSNPARDGVEGSP